MYEEPYRWVEAVGNRRQYLDEQFKQGSPVVALSYAGRDFASHRQSWTRRSCTKFTIDLDWAAWAIPRTWKSCDSACWKWRM